MPNGDHNDLQNPVMDFVYHTIIADTNSPRIPSFEFLNIGWARIGFQGSASRTVLNS